MRIMIALLVSCLVTAYAVETTEVNHRDGVPGRTFLKTTIVSGIVTKVDIPSRSLTITLETGESSVFPVSPEATAFDLLGVGDLVSFKLVTRMTVAMADDPTLQGSTTTDAIVVRSQATPKAMAAKTTRLEATVSAINLHSREVMLTFADGFSQTVTPRPDVDLSKRSVGEKVVFLITDAYAVEIQRQGK